MGRRLPRPGDASHHAGSNAASRDVRLSPRTLVTAVRNAVPDADLAGYRSLAAAISTAIDSTDIPVGARLPTERSLAAALGVSRGTVVAAFDLLRDEGYVMRRQGSGTWVRSGDSGAPEDPPAVANAAIRARSLAAKVLGVADAELIDMGLSVLDEPWMLDPTWFEVDADQLVADGRRHGYVPNGLSAVRSAFAARLGTRGIDTAAGQLATTHGGQHSLFLAARALIRPGDVVAIESPGYPGAVDVFARAGADLFPLPSGPAGVDVDAVRALVSSGRARAVFLMPSASNPLGTVAPGPLRREIAEIIDASDAWLIEDETLHPTNRDPKLAALAPIAAHMSSDRSILIGSLSKEIWSGLRVGWLRSTPDVVAGIGRTRGATDLGAPIAAQLAVLNALEGIDERSDLLRTWLGERATALQSLISEHLPSWEAPIPPAGLSLWCQLPAPLAESLAAAAPELGVSVLAGTATTLDDSGHDSVRVGFAMDDDRMAQGVERLAAAWAAVEAR